MTEALDIQSAITAAEKAAAVGDLAGAEACLRRAVELEEAAFGEAHPALAESLNNLAIVCERLDKPAEAERCYRRAYAIAVARLAPDHPAVATSAENLKAFCAARGLAFAPDGTPEVSPPAVHVPAATPEPSSRAAPELPTPSPTGVRPAPSQSSRGPAMTLVAVAALLLVAVVGMFVRSRSNAPAPNPAAADAPVAPAVAAPAEPTPTPVPPPLARSAAPATRAATPSRPVASTGSAAHPAAAALTAAELCRSLDTSGGWHCDPVSATVRGGVVYFFTRLASTADTTVEHRWYQGGRLRQAVTLHVRANPAGFRTYSRFTATQARAGRWRVEIRSADGVVLGEKEFTVGD